MRSREVRAAQGAVRNQLAAAGLILSPDAVVEIADFGLERYAQEGLGIVVRVNTPEYCSKWMTLLPGQACPMHYHKIKKETFLVLQGTVEIRTQDEVIVLVPGEQYTLFPGTAHTFSSAGGAVIEEVSTHDENEDSYFANPAIVRDPVVEED